MSLNQFNNQLGYGQFCLDAESTASISVANTWTALSLSYEDEESWQYNTQLDRGNIVLDIKGIWKIDATFTVQGATNDNMSLTIDDSNGAKLPELKWNQRGGNNWCINYSTIFNWQPAGAFTPVLFYVKNEDDTNNLTIKKGIIVCTKLY